MEKNNELLSLLENDSRLTPEQLAVMLDKEVGEIKDMIKNPGAIVSIQKKLAPAMLKQYQKVVDFYLTPAE